MKTTYNKAKDGCPQMKNPHANDKCCVDCGEDVCEHGLCYCNYSEDGCCHECARRKQLELDADREAKWQREVIGPLFGFDKE